MELCAQPRNSLWKNDEKQVENEMEWDAIEDTESINLGGSNFGRDFECGKDIELDFND